MDATSNRIAELEAQIDSLKSALRHWRRKSDESSGRIARLEAALEPFAAMHREGSDPDQMACQRGIASDATYLFSSHFADAAEALDA